MNDLNEWSNIGNTRCFQEEVRKWHGVFDSQLAQQSSQIAVWAAAETPRTKVKDLKIGGGGKSGGSGGTGEW